jgi:hypothetical protein
MRKREKNNYFLMHDVDNATEYGYLARRYADGINCLGLSSNW